MKKNVFAIIMIVCMVYSLCAQNLKHNAPYRSECISLARIDTVMYQEKIITLNGFNITTIVEDSSLYIIPSHLRDLDDRWLIDAIVRQDSTFTQLKLSWFFIWERTYDKASIHDHFSWPAIESLLIGYVVLILFFIAIVSLLEKSFKKGIRAFFSIIFPKDWNLILPVAVISLGTIIGIIVFIIHDIQYNTIGLNVLLGYLIYNGIIVSVFYLINLVRKKIFK